MTPLRRTYVVLLGWTDDVRIGSFNGKKAAREYAAAEGPKWRGGARVVNSRTGEVVWQERGSQRLPGWLTCPHGHPIDYAHHDPNGLGKALTKERPDAF